MTTRHPASTPPPVPQAGVTVPFTTGVAGSATVPIPSALPRLPWRTSSAVAVGNAAAALSRACGLGRGGIIGGRVMHAMHRGVLADLCRGRTVALVTGTNGKTTTTRMLARAVGTPDEVASNDSGANMPDGLIAALAHKLTARYAVLEVDERYLPSVLATVTPAVVVLLNLSRDQMDRVAEVRHTVRVWQDGMTSSPTTTVVANADDPLVVAAAQASNRQIWVGAGSSWHGDSVSCPRCSATLERTPDGWGCRRCGLRRPQPDWQVTGPTRLSGLDGQAFTVTPGLPGLVNVGNAAVAVAAAACLGVPVRQAVAGVESVTEVDGRYRVVDYRGHAVRTLLAKNPAGWMETLRILGDTTTHPLVLAINAREADGRDLSWLWDVPFEQLRGRHTTVCGERAADIAVRLNYAGVAHRVLADPGQAIASLPLGPVDVVANYSAFTELNGRLANG